MDCNRNNATAYNNIATAYFRLHQLQDAILNAKKFLEINPKMYQASTLLAIIYALLNDGEQSKKYFHISVSNGRDPTELQRTISYYKTDADIAE